MSIFTLIYFFSKKDKERERVLEKERKEAHKRERTELREEARKMNGGHYDPETVEDEHSTETVGPSSEPNSPVPILSEHEPQPYAHAMTHDISHHEPVGSLLVPQIWDVFLNNVSLADKAV